MKNVRRFNVDGFADENSEGNYVLYTDYEKLEQRYRSLLEMVKDTGLHIAKDLKEVCQP